jgi:nucleoside-triphosphatase
VGGFISPEEKHHGTRTAFLIRDIESGKEGTLASVEGDGPKVSKYHVDVKSFESIAIPAMERCEEYDVFVIDEIGRMEMKSRKFAWMLDRVIGSNTPLVVSLGKDYLRKYKALGEVFNLTGSNRETVYAQILEKAKESMKKKPKKKAPPKKKAKRKPAKKKKKPEKPKKKPVKKAKKKVKKKARRKKKAKKRAPKEREEAKKRAMEELEEKGEEEKGFFGAVRDLFGL